MTEQPQETVARLFMEKRGYNFAPVSIERVPGEHAWYFYYMLPDSVEVELEVWWEKPTQEGLDGWNVLVSDFSTDDDITPEAYLKKKLLD